MLAGVQLGIRKRDRRKDKAGTLGSLILERLVYCSKSLKFIWNAIGESFKKFKHRVGIGGRRRGRKVGVEKYVQIQLDDKFYILDNALWAAESEMG